MVYSPLYIKHFSDLCCYEDYLMRVDLLGKKHNDKEVLDSLPKCDNQGFIIANGEIIWIDDNGEKVDNPGIYMISESAFTYCDSIQRIVVPNSVKKIESRAFYYCTGLKSVTIPMGVTEIGWYAFDGCSQLTSVTIPDSVTTIGAGAFFNCRRMTSVEIPSSVMSIGSFAFQGCCCLTSIRIPKGCKISKTAVSYGCRVIRY